MTKTLGRDGLSLTTATKEENTTMSRPTLQIIIASTRPGRRGTAVAAWIRGLAADHRGFEVEVVDLASVGLPILDEPRHPRLQQYTQPHTKAWSATVDRADAFLFVTPEYNHSFPAALKNALDYLFLEWGDKPVGLVSYGGVSAGLRSVAALKPVLAALRMVPALEAVSIPDLGARIDEDDVFCSDARLDAAAKAMLDEVARLAGALASLRPRT
ncbi:NADPH-dependent FMN reductase [Nocardioides sp. NPDC058538]|uniref:NADPH-dependent FMN reductase n=1 Tax=Nocardioides sp. NPDC058538 TaxID=3346542 RepID=UPI0036514F1E